MNPDLSTTTKKLMTRKNYLRDHNLKYYELNHTYTAAIAKLREILESLPKENRYHEGMSALNALHGFLIEVVKDFDALQEGSAARNIIEDYAAQVVIQQKEIDRLTGLTSSSSFFYF